MNCRCTVNRPYRTISVDQKLNIFADTKFITDLRFFYILLTFIRRFRYIPEIIYNIIHLDGWAVHETENGERHIVFIFYIYIYI